MKSKDRRRQAEFDAGHRAYGLGHAYHSWHPAEWRKGWREAQRERLNMPLRSTANPAALPLGAPIVDVAALERKRMGRWA